ncbi:hypothetical protein CC78DRAFT_477140 [Lojkania enalia]|uniref:Zn(2)-C6 fungal-type domain-containing protein n=1 Tax=Lojkania enalia TaxID=147567 RepID=A0A9P4K049_9PLEO|nr:hypothetical protein CC78DRAFT_477140 [Didymosphaeria enalia]
MGDTRPRKRKFAPRSRQGCLTCRVRRKRCDGQHPECQNCIRLNMKCEWQTQRQVVPEANTNTTPVSPTTTTHVREKTPATPSDSTPIGAALFPWDIFSGDEANEKAHLLNYYIEEFVPRISIATTPSSFYTKLYIPMAMEFEGVLDAVLAMSSAQLARRTANPDRAKHLRALSSRHQSKCHVYIRDRISPSGEPLTDIYQVMAVILLLVGLEALNGMKDTKWVSQLNCVRKILNTLYADQANWGSWELEAVRRHFTYHDVMASVMAGVTTMGSQGLSNRDSPHLFTAAPSLTIDPLMGLSYQLCGWICRIQYVTPSNPAFPMISEAAFAAIEREIQQWQYESPISAPGVDLPVALDLIALAEAFRLAALIHLYRKSDSHKILIPSCASRAMEFISRIPPGSSADSSLLYPIFLAGAELDSETDIGSCSQRLTAIQARNLYENVGNVHKVLQEVWRPVLNGEERRDWEDVLREWGWTLSLS